MDNFGDHGRMEANLITLAFVALFSLVILGVIFPIVDTFSGYLIVGLLLSGAVMAIIRRLGEVNAMWHAMHDPIEKIRREDAEGPKFSSLDKDYYRYDEPEP